MTRKVLAGSLAVVIGLLAVWQLWLRDRGDDSARKPAAGSARSADITPTAVERDRKTPDAPRAGTPRWSIDIDPEGPLRLEGQVLGLDGSGVGGATVWLSSVPPRKVTTEDDGTFVFD